MKIICECGSELFKVERLRADSGYSDVIANTEFGVLQYKKALPADVLAIVNKYKGWVE